MCKNTYKFYTPSSTITGSGKVTVGNFNYIPANNEKVATDQIQNTALGSIHIDTDVKEFVRNAIIAELKFAGYKFDNNAPEIKADINKFLADDLGYSVDWLLDVTYTISKNGKVVYTKPTLVEFNSNKFIGVFQSLYKSLRLSFEELMNDKKVGQLLK